MVKIKKRNGNIVKFSKNKIIRGCKKAGASAKEAKKVASAVTKKLKRRKVIAATKLSVMVVKTLRRVNKKAASSFVKYRARKSRRKKK